MSNINTQGFGIQLAPAGFSLEANKIFDNYAAALEFVKTKPAAYVGSIIAVLAPSTIEGVTYPKGAYIVDAIGENAVLTQVGKETKFSIVKAETADKGYSTTYQLVKFQDGPNGTIVSVPVDGAAKINIPKDMVVSSGEIVVFTEDNLIPAVSGPGTYIRLNLANAQDPIYINVNDLVDAGAIAEMRNLVVDFMFCSTNLSRIIVVSPKVIVVESLEGGYNVQLSEQFPSNEYQDACIYSRGTRSFVKDAVVTVPIAYGKNNMIFQIQRYNEVPVMMEKTFSVVVLPPIKIGVTGSKDLLPEINISTDSYPYDECYHVHEVGFNESLDSGKNGYLCVTLPVGGGYDSLLSVSIDGHNVPMEQTNKTEIDGMSCFLYHSVDMLKAGTFNNIVLTVKDSVV